MLAALLLWSLPWCFYLLSWGLFKYLPSVFRRSFYALNGVLLLLGTGLSVYFAGYSGDQGGIAAAFIVLLMLVAELLAICLAAHIAWKNKR